MSDEKNTPQTESSSSIFENKFAYVTEEGELILKKTSLFEQRTLATVDPESVETKVDALESAFENVKIKMHHFFEELGEKESVDTESAKKEFEKLKEDVLSTVAIGDFESLISESQSRLEKAISVPKEESTETESENKDDAIADTDNTTDIKSETNMKKEETAEVKKDAVDKEEDEDVDVVAKDESNDKDVVKADTSKGESDVEVDIKDEVEAEKDTSESKPDQSDETAEAVEEVKDYAEGESEDDASEAEIFYKSLVEKVEQLVEVSDWAYVAMEFDNIDSMWKEGPEPEEDVDISGYRERIDQLRKEFEEKKQAHYEEQKRKKQANLEKKNAILESMQKIVDDEQWTATREVGKLKGNWERIKAVPAESAEELEKKFNALLKTFDDHKVDRLVKKKQKEEDNLTGKLVILEKMESFVEKLDESSKWEEMEENFEQLAKQFRKIGRVPVEKNQEVWNSYHTLQDTFHSMRFKHDKQYRNTIEKYLSRKKKLIDEAEALIDADDLADAARKVNKLHRRWKKAGNLPQKDENDLWDRFKAATDAFNEKKSENIDVLRDQEQQNLEEKHALIEKAEALKDSEDWEQTHKDLQSLMDKWKNVGPVPKRTSGKIWKKFKGAMDHFYNRRREYFKEVKEERKDNLKEKEEVLGKLRELRDHEDPVEAVNIAKPLQTEFKKAGYVPIKHKNRMWKEYREICDVIYDRFRAAKAAVNVVGKENVDNFTVDDIADIRKLNSKASSLRKQISKMEQELIQKKESLSYFKPSGKKNPLLDQVKQNIEKAEEDIALKEEQLAELEKKIDLIKKEGE